MSIRIVALLAVVILTLGASIASAGSIVTSTLTDSNGCCGAGPFGTVTIDLTSPTMATITFTANPGFLFLDTNSAGVNVNATSWFVSGLTGTALPGFSGPDLSNTGAGQMDGFGMMNQTFKEFDGFTWALQTMTFMLTNNTGIWTSAGNVLKTNGTAFDAAHIGECSATPCTINTPFANTGFAAEPKLPGGAVPEPASLVLFGTMLFGGALLAKRMMNA